MMDEPDKKRHFLSFVIFPSLYKSEVFIFSSGPCSEVILLKAGKIATPSTVKATESR
jgi:hypothetical protein